MPTTPIAPTQPAPAPPPAPKAHGARISQYDLSEFPVVRLFTSVTDTRGLPIKNLLPEDFSISENGEPVDEVRFANPEVFDLPLAICFVIDVSGSMQGEVARGALRFGRPVGGEVEDVPSPLDLEVEAVKAFIRQLARDDRVALVKFADAVVTVENFTDDKGVVTDALDHLRAFGQTRLYDAIRKGMALARHETGYRRAVIVLSDGMDNASTETPDTLMEFFRDEVLAKNESFSVFTLGLGDQIDVNGLTYVADGTGGMFFESPTAYDLKEIYQTILDQILNEYVLEYDSREMRQGAIVEGTVTAQTIGRTARNVNAEVILYADSITDSMRRAMDETARRRALQEKYNREHDITPETIKKGVRRDISDEVAARKVVAGVYGTDDDGLDVEELVSTLEDEMYKAAGRLDFEEAARLRDEILKLRPDRSAIIMTPRKKKAALDAKKKSKRTARQKMKKYIKADRRRKNREN